MCGFVDMGHTCCPPSTNTRLALMLDMFNDEDKIGLVHVLSENVSEVPDAFADMILDWGRTMRKGVSNGS